MKRPSRAAQAGRADQDGSVDQAGRIGGVDLADRDSRAQAPAGSPEPAPRRASRFRNPATGLPKLWVEAVVLVALYYVYTGTRGVAGTSAASAMDLGWDILHLQERLHLDIELGLNRWLQSVPALAVASCYYYATLHFIVTPALLVWMYRRHPGRYVRARWALVFTTLISLCGFFLFPTAPPRLLPGTSYVDTMSHFEEWGWWSGGASAAPDGLEGLANQYAAMPSLHCAWALWCGFVLARFARTPLVRVIGCLYPAATVFVVMSTSNHYILDAVAGWAVLGVSALLALAVTAHGRHRQVEVVPASAPPQVPASVPPPASASASVATPASVPERVPVAGPPVPMGEAGSAVAASERSRAPVGDGQATAG